MVMPVCAAQMTNQPFLPNVRLIPFNVIFNKSGFGMVSLVLEKNTIYRLIERLKHQKNYLLNIP